MLCAPSYSLVFGGPTCPSLLNASGGLGSALDVRCGLLMFVGPTFDGLLSTNCKSKCDTPGLHSVFFANPVATWQASRAVMLPSA
eukprot:666422-Amphidinium_carterae.1